MEENVKSQMFPLVLIFVIMLIGRYTYTCFHFLSA